MKQFIFTMALLVGLAVPAWGDYETGLMAYRNAYFEEALRNWTPLAIDGDARAQFYLGEIYVDGMGVPINLHKAVRFYRQAAEQEHPGALARLGMLRARGRGVSQNYAKALAWYRRAAVLGDLDAQYRLGFLYEAGRGTQPNLEHAFKWWAIAARWGDPDAAKERDRIKAQVNSQVLDSLQQQVMLWRSSGGDIYSY
ncbi:MAG TPA: sel1 repeat family protein [Acidiferrobacteraceae bacterium]|nr:sel1 repeat family protein [Acidiferrobacteraceae bacterium]